MSAKSKLIIHFILVIIVLIIVSTIILFPQPDNTEKIKGDEEFIPFHFAWEGVTSEQVPTSPPVSFKEIPIGENDMMLISSSDNNNKITQSWETQEEDGYPYQLYQIPVNDSIDNIWISWEGYGSQPFMGTNKSKVDIFIFNNSTSGWDKLSHEGWTSEENDRVVVLTVHDIYEYSINESLLQNRIYILILGPYGAGNSTATLSTDYVIMKSIDNP